MDTLRVRKWVKQQRRRCLENEDVQDVGQKREAGSPRRFEHIFAKRRVDRHDPHGVDRARSRCLGEDCGPGRGNLIYGSDLEKRLTFALKQVS